MPCTNLASCIATVPRDVIQYDVHQRPEITPPPIRSRTITRYPTREKPPPLTASLTANASSSSKEKIPSSHAHSRAPILGIFLSLNSNRAAIAIQTKDQ